MKIIYKVVHMKKLLLFAALFTANAYVSAQLLPSEAGTIGKERFDINVKAEKVQTPSMLQASPTLKATSRLDWRAAVKSEKLAETLENGSSIYIVELKDGSIVRRLETTSTEPRQTIVSSQTKSSPSSRTAAQTPVVSFSEGFEGWDEETFDWIPDGWVDESKTGMVPTEKQNLTWYTTSGDLNYPTEGFYMGTIKVELINNNTETIEQDEWLISPEIRIEADNRLEFDLCFKPGWVLFDPKTFSFTAQNTTLQVLVTSDKGETWKEIWNATNEAKTYSYAELTADLQTIYGTWIRKQIDLSEYVDKDIKLAFRFVGKNGEAMSLDNIRIAPPMPDPLYRQPIGSFYIGFNEDFLSLNNSFMLSPAYQDLTWYNFSSLESEYFKWSIADPNTGNTVDYSDTDLTANYPYAVTNLPVLTGYTLNGKYASTYQWGNINQDYIQYGGSTTFNLGDGSTIEMGAGNYDLYNSFTIGMVDEGSYIFGTNSSAFWGAQYQVTAIANLFEKPLRKYAFDRIWLHCLDVKADPDAEFKLTIYRVDESGVIQEQIASSICYGAEVIDAFTADGMSYNSVPFTFMETDPYTGRERKTWLEIEDAIFVELSGFTSKKVQSFAPCFQYYPHPTYDNFAYVYISYAGNTSDLYSVNEVLPTMYTSFLFGMNVAYPFMLTDDDTYIAPVEGGTKEFIITSFYDTDSWKTNKIPEWITIGDSYKNSNEDIVLPVTVDPLTSGNGRSFDIEITTYASDLTLHIKQGATSNIEILNDDRISAVRYGEDAFNLTYPAGMDRVSIVDITGKVIISYKLSAEGNFILPASMLNKGIYILKFEGEKNEAIKIIK